MSFLFLLLDIISFSVSIALGLLFRTGAVTDVSFISNLKILVVPFIISVIILWLFSFYDFKYINRRVFDYKNIMIAFFIDFFFSAGSIYFLASIFHATTPKTVLVITLAIYFIFVYFSVGYKKYREKNSDKSDRMSSYFLIFSVVSLYYKPFFYPCDIPSFSSSL